MPGGATSCADSWTKQKRGKQWFEGLVGLWASDVVLLNVVPDWVVEVQLGPVGRLQAVPLLLLLLDAAGAPLGLALPIQETTHHHHHTQSDEDHCSHHT